MTVRNTWRPDWAVAPGETIRETLEERGWSQTRLASELAVSASYVSDIIRARRSISPHVALGLERTLSIRAEFWLNLQVNYDLALARRAALAPGTPVDVE